MKKVLLLLFYFVSLSGYSIDSNSSSYYSIISGNKTSIQLVQNSLTPPVTNNDFNNKQHYTSVSPTLNWSKQIGAITLTRANGVSADATGDSYTVGSTTAGISNQIQTGNEDYFITKYNLSGSLSWSKQVGAYGGTTIANGVSADNNGNTYVAGYTNSGISGEIQTGKNDYFIAKYDVMGNLLWSKQLGVANGNTYATSIKTDILNNVTYISGYTDSGISGGVQTGKYDYFIAKYDYNGNLIWSKQVGFSGGTTKANGVAVDSHGNAYIAGFTNKAISGQFQTGYWDYFIANYDLSGNLIWSRQVGNLNGTTKANGVSADLNNNIYVAGYTSTGISGELQNGINDYFIAKYIN